MRSKEKNLKVCYIYQDQYPWEVRTEKITTTLAKEGFEVHIICRNRDGLSRDEKILENMYIHRLPGGVNKLTRDLLNFPAFFSPFWILKIIDIVKKYFIDVVIVRDLPLSPAAYIAGKITNRPVIMDMAENYPAMIRDTWTFRGPKIIDYIIRNPFLLKWLESIIVPLMDGIFVVSEISAKRIEKLRKNNKNIWVISNTPIVDKENKQFRSSHLAKSIRERSDFVLLYIGGLEESRGLDIVIKAIPYLAPVIKKILFVIVGEGTSKSKLKTLVRQLGIEKHVFFAGWIPYEEIPSIIKSSDICLVPHYVTEHTDTTLPNKLFDYMAQKKTVIVTQAKPLIEIVKTANCGLVYNDKSPTDLANAILKLKNTQIRKTLGINGWIAVNEKFNWNHEKEQLINAIMSINNSYIE